jgi:xanthine dehydrogenase accessory factor
MLEQYLNKLQELEKKNEPFVMATVVRREAPSSGKVGDKAIVNKWGEISGWIGGGCVQGIVVKETQDALRTGKPRLVRIGKNLADVQKQDGTMEYTMTCQSEGAVEIFIEPVLPLPHLVVMGKSDIAKALVKLGKTAGYRVTGVAAEANLQTFEKVDELITQLSLVNVKTTAASFIVVATQGMNDELALSEALKKESAYVGFVSSRKKAVSIKQYLLDAGFEKEKVDAIYSPAGIDVNAKQPLEVAISILAEIIQVKNSLEAFTTFEVRRELQDKPATAPQWYINPVCGVPVDMNNPKHIVEYKEEKVYFCCDGCKVKFDKDPEKYIKAREMGLAPEGM